MKVLVRTALILIFASLGLAQNSSNMWYEVRNYSLGNSALSDARNEAIIYYNPARLGSATYKEISIKFHHWRRNWREFSDSQDNAFMNLSESSNFNVFTVLGRTYSQDWANFAVILGRRNSFRRQESSYMGDELIQNHIGIAWGSDIRQSFSIGAGAVLVSFSQPNSDEALDSYSGKGLHLVLSGEYDIKRIARVNLSLLNDALGKAPVFYEDEFGSLILMDSPPMSIIAGLHYYQLKFLKMSFAVELPLSDYKGEVFFSNKGSIDKFESDSSPIYRFGIEGSLFPEFGVEGLIIDLRAGIVLKKLLIHPEIEIKNANDYRHLYSAGIGLNFGADARFDVAVGIEPFKSIVEDGAKDISWREEPCVFMGSFTYNLGSN